jgi:hypothetical protein
MYQRRPSKFNKYRSNGRRFQSRGNGSNKSNGQIRSRSQLFNDQPRNKFRPIHNPEKLFEKYSTLAKEALSSGDKTLSENYLQHADHYTRLIGEKNKNNQLNNKDQNIQEKTEDTNINPIASDNLKEVK